MLRDAFLRAGVENINERLFLVNRNGLLHDGRADLTEHQKPFTQPLSDNQGFNELSSLSDIIQAVKPSVLLSVSGAASLFTKEIVTHMRQTTNRPIIMPMSNPTSRAEATPSDLLDWTDGRALIVTGSPFEPVEVGRRRVVSSKPSRYNVLWCIRASTRNRAAHGFEGTGRDSSIGPQLSSEVSGGVVFETNSSTLGEEGKQLLSGVPNLVKRSDGNIDILGHTDNSGSLAQNLNLNRLREFRCNVR